MELNIRGVAKTYSNGVQALKDVTLTIPAGIYGLRSDYPKVSAERLLDCFAVLEGSAPGESAPDDGGRTDGRPRFG